MPCTHPCLNHVRGISLFVGTHAVHAFTDGADEQRHESHPTVISAPAGSRYAHHTAPSGGGSNTTPGQGRLPCHRQSPLAMLNSSDHSVAGSRRIHATNTPSVYNWLAGSPVSCSSTGGRAWVAPLPPNQQRAARRTLVAPALNCCTLQCAPSPLSSLRSVDDSLQRLNASGGFRPFRVLRQGTWLCACRPLPTHLEVPGWRCAIKATSAPASRLLFSSPASLSIPRAVLWSPFVCVFPPPFVTLAHPPKSLVLCP